MALGNDTPLAQPAGQLLGQFSSIDLFAIDSERVRELILRRVSQAERRVDN